MNINHSYPSVLKVSEAAALLGVSSGTLRRWDKAGKVIALRTPSGHRRYQRSHIETLLSASPVTKLSEKQDEGAHDE